MDSWSDEFVSNRADARNLEMQLAAMKDSESDLLQKIDMLTRDNQDLQDKVTPAIWIEFHRKKSNGH